MTSTSTTHSTTPTDALTHESTSRSVDLPSGRMHYHEAGAPEAHPLVLVHGSGAGASGWSNFSPNIAVLAEHFRVLAIDVIGWGESDPVRDNVYTGPIQIIEFLDALGIQEAALVGNSMGGLLTTATAARHPERVSHLITMGAAAFTDIPSLFGAAGPSEGIKVLIEGYLDPSPETMKKLVQVMAFDPAMASDELAAERSAATRARPDHLPNALQGFATGALLRWQATAAEAATITAPTLLIHGRDDRVVHFENSMRLLSVIPDSRLLLLNRCGHWAQLEHADEFNRQVIEFVTHHGAGTR